MLAQVSVPSDTDQTSAAAPKTWTATLPQRMAVSVSEPE